jgi:hypothetical protein
MGLYGSSVPVRMAERDSALLARQYRPQDGYDPPAASASPRGFLMMKPR